VKRIIFSDLHLNTWSYGATVTGDGFNSRLYAQCQALIEMATYAEENDIRYVYFCGDLFHTPGKVPTQALQLAHEAFSLMKSKGLHLRFLVGNHDVENRTGTIHALKWLDQFGHVVEGDAPAQWVDAGLPIHALGYTEDAEKITRTLATAGNDSMVLLHQGVDGHALGSGYVLNDVLTPEMIGPNIRHCFTGHYHRNDYVTKNLTIVGAMTPLTWSDLNESKGFLVWDDETNKVTQCASEIPPKFTTVQAEDLAAASCTDLSNCFVRVMGRPKDTIEEVRELLTSCGALKVEFHMNEADANKASVRQAFKTFDIQLGVKQAEKEVKPARKVVGEQLRALNYISPLKLKEFN
jgi:DNA repair exonuclease SbcCD nuclease subunit